MGALIHDPELQKPLRDAASAYEKLKPGSNFNAQALKPIIAAARSSRRPLFRSGAQFLGRLAVSNQEARDVVVGMSNDKRAHVRFNAIICLFEAKAQRDFSISILRKALRDTSARVRTMAADFFLVRDRDELIPDLTAAMKLERNATAKVEMNLSLGLLRDGFFAERIGSTYDITYPNRKGFSSQLVPVRIVKKLGIDTVVAELKSGKDASDLERE